ncbi:MAG TPA: ATP-binding protein [bacterium]
MNKLDSSSPLSEQNILDANSVCIDLDESVCLPEGVYELDRNITEYFHNNKFDIIINLEKIKLPPSRFIAVLIKATCQARRMGGDIKLLNLQPSFRSNLVTFSPRTYLAIETSEQYAFADFGETFIPQNEFDISENASLITANSHETEPASERIESDLTNQNKGNWSQALALAQDCIRVQSKAENLYQICDFVLENAEKAGFDLRERGKIKVTVYEACLNVVEHAYFSNPDHWIQVWVGYNKEKFVIVIQDWGESFKFDPSRPYDVEQAVKDRRTGGFGLHIIRRTVEEINYISDPRHGNRLILVKAINVNKSQCR